MASMERLWQEVQERIRQEFRLKFFDLDHREPRDFIRSPWPWFSSPKQFLMYRTLICLYQVCTYATVHSIYGIGPESLIGLTELGYIILTVHSIVSAGLCFVDVFGMPCRPKSPEDRPTFPNNDVTVTARSTDTIHQTSQTPLKYYKQYWVLYNVVFGIGLYITIAYWALLADDEGPRSILFNAMNCVVIVIDVSVSALPLRLLHFVYPSAFALAYVIFTVIYWVAGGTDKYNNPWIYSVLDYVGNPAKAAGIAAGSILVAVPLCHVNLFGLAVAREMLAGNVKRRSANVNVDVQMGQRHEGSRTQFSAYGDFYS